MAYVMSDTGENGVTTYYYTLSLLVTPKSNTFEFSLIIEALNVSIRRIFTGCTIFFLCFPPTICDDDSFGESSTV